MDGHVPEITALVTVEPEIKAATCGALDRGGPLKRASMPFPVSGSEEPDQKGGAFIDPESLPAFYTLRCFGDRTR